LAGKVARRGANGDMKSLELEVLLLSSSLIMVEIVEHGAGRPTVKRKGRETRFVICTIALGLNSVSPPEPFQIPAKTVEKDGCRLNDEVN
jgi:hypothetical protein